jgi:hypothetical protein
VILRRYLMESREERFHLGFFAGGPAFAKATARLAEAISRNDLTERREEAFHF